MALSDEQTSLKGIRRAVQKAARCVGLHIGRYPPVDSLAYHLQTLFRELGIDCVLDVGAHQGEFVRFLRDLRYAGEIHSFEPVNASFSTLLEVCAADPRWRGHHIALGNEDCERQMNIFNGSVFNSFLPPAADPARRFARNTQLVGAEKVTVRRLESVIEEILAARPAAHLFLKMDTQGYDLEVVRGAGPRIEAIMALQTELPVRATYAGAPSLPEAFIELSGLGFDVTGMFPVARELDHLRIIEFDCVMCRKPERDGRTVTARADSR